MDGLALAVSTIPTTQIWALLNAVEHGAPARIPSIIGRPTSLHLKVDVTDDAGRRANHSNACTSPRPTGFWQARASPTMHGPLLAASIEDRLALAYVLLELLWTFRLTTREKWVCT